MINYMQVENFKSIKKLALPLENLNLFFGMNGMGKSSVIQALLLLRQSFWENQKAGLDCLHTNGDIIQLGTGKDIFCQSGSSDIIRFYVQFSDSKKYDCCYKYELNDPDSDQLIKVGKNAEEDYSESLFSEQFSYLGAEHLGPRKQYSVENWKKNRAVKFGITGEFVVPFLAQEGEKIRIPDEMCIETGKTNRLIDQVSAWMAEISPGIKITAEMLPAIEKAKLGISYSGDRLVSEAFLPVNVGFGIPYVLPLIVELLISDKNSLLLIENPESHLHPKGQTMMANLISLAAEHGCQIICESHSDHIINGVRVAIKKGKISNEKTGISFFSKNQEQETRVDNIFVDKKGNLSDYPAGLLDEWGILMTELI
jgi:predicted ATPase